MNKHIVAGGLAAVMGLVSNVAHADIEISPPHLPGLHVVVQTPTVTAAPAYAPVGYARPVYVQQPAPVATPVYVQPSAPVYVQQPSAPVYVQQPAPAFAPGAVSPQDFSADMNARMNRQMRVIQWRVQNGSLSPVALQDAREDRESIEGHIRWASRDGMVDRREARQIRAMVRSMGVADQDVAPVGGGPGRGWDNGYHRGFRDGDRGGY